MEVAGSIIKRVRLLKHETTDSFFLSFSTHHHHPSFGCGSRSVGRDGGFARVVCSFVRCTRTQTRSTEYWAEVKNE